MSNVTNSPERCACVRWVFVAAVMQALVFWAIAAALRPQSDGAESAWSACERQCNEMQARNWHRLNRANDLALIAALKHLGVSADDSKAIYATQRLKVEIYARLTTAQLDSLAGTERYRF